MRRRVNRMTHLSLCIATTLPLNPCSSFFIRCPASNSSNLSLPIHARLACNTSNLSLHSHLEPSPLSHSPKPCHHAAPVSQSDVVFAESG